MFPFPEDRFHCDSPDYIEQITRGRQTLARLSVAVLFLARDCAKQLPDTIRTVEAIGRMCGEWRAFAYENDSKDGTPMILSEWTDAQPRASYRSHLLSRRKWPMVRSAQRGSHMAEYRNQVRAMAIEGMPDADAYLLLDSDLAGYSLDGIAHSFGDWGEWDISASNGIRNDNGRWHQADAWAWREGTWKPKTFEQVKHRVPPRGSPMVPLLSHFGGLASYTGEAFRSAEYGGGELEHTVFHQRLAKAGFDRVRMNPSQIVVYRF